MLGFDVKYDFESFFADQEEIVYNSSNRIRCTVNPLLTSLSFAVIYFKHVWGGGGGRAGARIRVGGVF